MSKKKGSDLFIRISDPIEMRRNILSSSRALVKCMQSYEKVREVRVRKTDHLLKLKALMKETRSLMNKLKQLMPASKFAPIPARFKHARARIPTGDELDSLEKDLADVEGKLHEF